MNKMNLPRLAAAASITAGLAVAMTAPAQPSGGGGVENTGQCSAGSDWKVKAKHDNGLLEVEGEVDSNVVGQGWNWRFLDNGTLAAKGTSTTQTPSGSFEARRRIADLAGSDWIVQGHQPGNRRDLQGQRHARLDPYGRLVLTDAS